MNHYQGMVSNKLKCTNKAVLQNETGSNYPQIDIINWILKIIIIFNQTMSSLNKITVPFSSVFFQALNGAIFQRILILARHQ